LSIVRIRDGMSDIYRSVPCLSFVVDRQVDLLSSYASLSVRLIKSTGDVVSVLFLWTVAYGIVGTVFGCLWYLWLEVTEFFALYWGARYLKRSRVFWAAFVFGGRMN